MLLIDNQVQSTDPAFYSAWSHPFKLYESWLNDNNVVWIPTRHMCVELCWLRQWLESINHSPWFATHSARKLTYPTICYSMLKPAIMAPCWLALTFQSEARNPGTYWPALTGPWHPTGGYRPNWVSEDERTLLQASRTGGNNSQIVDRLLPRSHPSSTDFQTRHILCLVNNTYC